MDIYQTGKMTFRHVLICLVSTQLFWAAQAAAGELSPNLRGDIGAGGYYTRGIVRSQGDDFSVLPYLDFDYGRLFARVDTIGIRTLKVGYGYFELVGRISQDGFRTNTSALQGLGDRETSIPLGIGTLQVTPAGGIWLNAFHDISRSKGNLFEATYGGEVDLPQVTFYPMFGAEYQSGEYVRYYYGISAQEAANSQYSTYQPGERSTTSLG